MCKTLRNCRNIRGLQRLVCAQPPVQVPSYRRLRIPQKLEVFFTFASQYVVYFLADVRHFHFRHSRRLCPPVPTGTCAMTLIRDPGTADRETYAFDTILQQDWLAAPELLAQAADRPTGCVHMPGRIECVMRSRTPIKAYLYSAANSSNEPLCISVRSLNTILYKNRVCRRGRRLSCVTRFHTLRCPHLTES